MERWSGRVALVTGASSGIGACITRRLASHGLKVVACARRVEKIQEIEEEVKKSGASGEVYPVRCDLRRESDITDMFRMIREKYNRIDVCINNAGILWQKTLLEATSEQWRDMLDVNVLALCICTKEAVKLMRERSIDDGQVIHISSMSGHRLTTNDLNFYAATKHAVRALTEGLRRELAEAKSHIRISSVSPGDVTTPLAQQLPSTGPKIREMDVDDIADTVVYILSAKPHVQVHDVLIRPVEQLT